MADSDQPSIQFHGYAQNRFYGAPGANPEFRVERISLSTIASLPNNSTGYVEVYYQPYTSASGIYLESAYYETPLGDGTLRVGRGRRYTFGITPTYPNRKTSNYGLVDESFTQDRIQGLQYMRDKNGLQFGAALHTGYRIDTKFAGDIPGDEVNRLGHMVPHICFRDGTLSAGSTTGLSDKLALSSRLGGTWKNGLSVGASVYVSSLDDRDLRNMNSTDNILTPNFTSTTTGTSTPLLHNATSHKFNVEGLDFMYKHKSGFVAQGEFYDATISTLSYNAWDTLAGWETPTGWKYYVRYGQQNMNTPKTDNPLTWDNFQTTFSVVEPIKKNVWMQYEYELNTQRPAAGMAKIDDNLFFAELFTGF
jgi:hypothetical protein